MAAPWRCPGLTPSRLIVEAWLGGQAGAGAVADVVFGKVNPSGKLAETFPLRLEDTPAFLNFPGRGRARCSTESASLQVIAITTSAGSSRCFPSATAFLIPKFSYSDLEVSAEHASDTDSLTATVTVTTLG